MDNRPRGRDKYVSGQGKGVQVHGPGLGSGPVGRSDGYSGRRGGGSRGSGGSSGPTRGGGGGLLKIILVVAVLLLGGGGLSGLFSGGLGGLLGGLFGGGGGSDILSSFTGGGSVSTGWVSTANTGRLNTSVAAGARDKYTVIKGDGSDVYTVMVYMCGTDLESKHGMATSDIQEMMNARLGSKVNLLVYTGGCTDWKKFSISNKVNQIYKVENGGITCLVKDDGTAAMTKPATLTRFINYCKQNYKANRYALIFWDHGGGSLSGYGYDERTPSAGSMTLKGIDEALKAADTKFDFIGFDACLMATLENGLMLNDYADYMIASEETEPGVGWYYTNWLTDLSANTGMATVKIGQKIVDDFVDTCERRCPGQKTTLSVVDLAELSATVPDKLRAFASDTSRMLQGGEYQAVSDARSGAREFSSNNIDQIDLCHLAYNLNTADSKALASTLQGAVKYNRTCSAITNAYGLSVYFPYRKTSKVDSAVATYEAIGVDSAYSRCIQQFASMEVGGQAASGGESSPLGSLLGNFIPGGSSTAGGIGDILGGLLSGSFKGFPDLDADNTGFLQQGLTDTAGTAEYIAAHRFDDSALKWTKSGGHTVMSLPEEQWKLVQDLQLNVFYNNGNGYIDLGLDNVFDFTEEGDLLGEYDNTWLAIDKQPVAYYYVDALYEGEDYVITGRVPVLLNDQRAELLIVFDNAHPRGYIAGARAVYADGETQTVAKGVTELTVGDAIQPLADFYSYDGVYMDTYRLGDTFTYTGKHEISNVYLDDPKAARATYLFTDIYCGEHWTPVMP